MAGGPPPEVLGSDVVEATAPAPAWTPAELCTLSLPNGGVLTAIITVAGDAPIAWHIDYRHGHTVQTIEGREEPSIDKARETAWEVMQIMCASLLEEGAR